MTTNVGQKMTIKIHENASGVVVFDSVTIVDFTHLAGFTGATTVFKNDVTGTPNDAFTVQITTDYLNLFSDTLTVAQLIALAVAAVDAVYGNGEAGPMTPTPTPTQTPTPTPTPTQTPTPTPTPTQTPTPTPSPTP